MKKLELFKAPWKLLILLVVAIGIVNLSGCNKDDDNPPTQTILEIVESREGLDSLAKYLGFFPSLTASLEADGSFTLFAPTNTAFISLLETEGFPPNIEQVNPLIIQNVLAYHLSTTNYTSGDLSSGTTISTQSQGNEVITINNDGSLFTGSTTSNIPVITADIQATNGTVHTVGSVLIPPSVGAQLTPLLPTTAGTLLLGADFTILAAGIGKADVFAAATDGVPTLTSILTGTATHTVFAPTNATFNAGSITVDTYTGQQWYGIIANHIVLQEVTGETLTSTGAQDPGLQYTSAADVSLYVNYSPANPTNGIGVYIDSDGDQVPNAEVVVPDVVIKDNGRIHVIAGVLAPPAPQ